MSNQKKQEVLRLLTLDKKKFDQMGEQDLVTTMEKLDQIKVEAVKEGRFLGEVKRR